MTSRAQAGVQLVTDTQTAYKLLEAAGDDPSKLSREVAKIAPDTIMRVFGITAGKALPIAGYFISIGIDVLDADFAKGVLDARLHYIVMNNLQKTGIIDHGDGTYETLQRNISQGQYQEFVKNAIQFKLEHESRKMERSPEQEGVSWRILSANDQEIDKLQSALYAGLAESIEKVGEGQNMDALMASATLACAKAGLCVDDIHTMEITNKGTISVSDEWGGIIH